MVSPMPVKAAFICGPKAVRQAMMATAIRAAIRPYSMAVAPDSSLAKFLMKLRMNIFLLCLSEQQFHYQGHRFCPLDPRLHGDNATPIIKGE
ncbi:hypothetical protein D3C85_1651610 [compost metagenome]